MRQAWRWGEEDGIEYMRRAVLDECIRCALLALLAHVHEFVLPILVLSLVVVVGT